VVGFSGRVLSGDEKTAKYVNSPETPIFTKSKIFFGLDKSKRALLDAGFAVVCEGQLDLIACFMGGVQNVVAPQGTAFTADHARIIKRYVEEVVLCFDSDDAGQNAAIRSLDHLLASGLAVRVAVVPEPHDPDSFIKASGGAAFKELVHGAEGFFVYYLKRLCAANDVTTDKGRLVVLRTMAETVAKTQNSVLMDEYARKTASRLGVSPAAGHAEFKKQFAVNSPLRHHSEKPAAGQVIPPSAGSGDDSWLLKYLFLHEDLVEWASAHLDPAWLQNPSTRQVVSKRLEAHKDQSWTSLTAFLDRFESTELRTLITEATAQERPIPSPDRQLKDLVLKLRNQYLDRQKAALEQKMSQRECTEAERLDLLRQQLEFRSRKGQPLQPL
jgi:DNA primase